MAVVASATGVALGMTAGTIGAGLVGGAVLGAGIGGLYSAVTGDGNILNSMLTGGLIGGAAGGLGAAYGPGIMGKTAGTGAIASGATTAAGTTPALTAAQSAAPGFAYTPAGEMVSAAYEPAITGAANAAGFVPPSPAGIGSAGYVKTPSVMEGLTKGEMLGYGLAGTTALSLLGGMNQPKLSSTTGTTPSYIRPYTYSSTPVASGDDYPSPYPNTPTYGANGLPILDTRERRYVNQSYTAGTPYQAANGGLMSEGGKTEEDLSEIARRNFLKKTSTKELQQMLDSMDEQQFLMKHMPNYAESMRPSILGMIEGAQYGDRMAKSYGGKPRDINVMPTMVDPQSGMYGGIASIGRDIDPNTRINAMANLQRTPYDRNAMDAVRQIGVGIDRQIGKDASLSAFYEQDPMGRNKMGGARYTQRFNNGGITYDAATQRYSGLPSSNPVPAAPVTELPADLVASLTPQYQAANPNFFSYDAKNQRYGAGIPSMSQLNAFKAEQDRKEAEAMAAAQAAAYQPYDGGGGANGGLMPQGLRYANGGAMGGEYNLGSYSDGGRLLKGPGDGVSDDIPAVIGEKQPARLADGEFVIPARIVSELGNGSTDAGAKRLYEMMDKIQAGRKKTIGKKNVAKDTKAKKHLLA